MRKTVEERFWEKVEKTETCWLWKGSLIRGYGHIRVGKQKIKAHRYSWILHNGALSPIQTEHPNGTCVLHRCDNPPCVRPDHLFIGSNEDNMKDRHEKGRDANLSGEARGLSKLVPKQVLEIRDLYKSGKYTQRQIGLVFGVHQKTVSNIITLKHWRGVSG